MINATSGIPDLQSSPAPATPPGPTSSPSFTPASPSIVTPAPSSTAQSPLPKKSKVPLRMIVGLLVVGLTIVGAGVGFFLTQQNQDIRQDASTAICPSYGGSSSCWGKATGATCASNSFCTYGGGVCTCNYLAPNTPPPQPLTCNPDKCPQGCWEPTSDGGRCKEAYCKAECRDGCATQDVNGGICNSFCNKTCLPDVEVCVPTAGGGFCQNDTPVLPSPKPPSPTPITRCSINSDTQCGERAFGSPCTVAGGGSGSCSGSPVSPNCVCQPITNVGYCNNSSDSTCQGKAYDASCTVVGGGSGTCKGSGSAGPCVCSPRVSPSPTPGTGGQPTIPPGGNCAAALQSCESSSCCSGLVCQGSAGNRKCQQADTNACPGGTCTGYYSFQCSSLAVTSGSSGIPVCEANPQYHATDRNAAIARASQTGCGQWDQVCVGGTRNGQLCGDFAIINQSCGTSTPPASPTTPPTNPPGPMCMSITMTNTTRANQSPIKGDAIRFTCGAVTGATSYVFQVVEPDQNIVKLDATGTISSTFTVTKSGKHYAQCQYCTGSGNSLRCQEFEKIKTTR